MNKIGLRFLFGGSLFFMAITDEVSAKKLIRSFGTGTLPEMLSAEDGSWAIRSSSIQAIHLQPIEEMTTQQQYAAPFVKQAYGSRLSGNMLYTTS